MYLSFTKDFDVYSPAKFIGDGGGILQCFNKVLSNVHSHHRLDEDLRSHFQKITIGICFLYVLY